MLMREIDWESECCAYALFNLPSHLVDAGLWESLLFVLSDVVFLEKRADSGLLDVR